MAKSTELDKIFEAVKQAYPHDYQQGDTTWRLVDGYVATKNFAYDGQLMLQSVQKGAHGDPVIKTYNHYKIDEEELA